MSQAHKAFNIVVLDAHTVSQEAAFWQPLQAMGNVTLYPITHSHQVAERVKGMQVVLTNKVALTKAHIEKMSSVGLIGVLATGFDHIDVHAAKKANIVVSNIQNYSTDSVAQHVFALILNVTNDTARLTNSVKEGIWQNNQQFCYWYSPLSELANKTLGIIGFGHIGRKVSEIALSFGMKVIAYSRTEKEVDGISFVSLSSLLESSDIISLHCPLTENTHQIINEQTLSQLKETAILINTGRGGLIDELALARALQAGQLAGACLDVLVDEPPKAKNPLIGLDNCFITPHVAWATVEARQRLVELTKNNLEAFIKAHPINQVI
jgi:glycerate dehydrogenase